MSNQDGVIQTKIHVRNEQQRAALSMLITSCPDEISDKRGDDFEILSDLGRTIAILKAFQNILLTVGEPQQKRGRAA